VVCVGAAEIRNVVHDSARALVSATQNIQTISTLFSSAPSANLTGCYQQGRGGAQREAESTGDAGVD
jgi:hypothetical protein